MSGRYRLAPSDEIDLSFPFVPEFDQTLVVQPDGYVTVRPVGEIRVQGRTVPQLRQMLLDAFAETLRDPVVSIVLREFERPFFLTAGELNAPGRFELRGALTLTQALAMAGGFKESAKHSQVILFRRHSGDLTEVKEVDVKKMLASRELSEDPLLRPGDTVFVPRSLMSKLKPYIPTASLGFFLNPWQR